MLVRTAGMIKDIKHAEKILQNNNADLIILTNKCYIETITLERVNVFSEIKDQH